jgi:hypothetical protein
MSAPPYEDHLAIQLRVRKISEQEKIKRRLSTGYGFKLIEISDRKPLS